jgi:hypothetical protein
MNPNPKTLDAKALNPKPETLNLERVAESINGIGAEAVFELE